LPCVTALSFPTPSDWSAAKIHPDPLSTPDERRRMCDAGG
jgi:hypothetical protein